MNPVKLEFYNEIPDEWRDPLWKQGVSLDDWDYMLFIKAPVPEAFTLAVMREHWEPSEPHLERLLTGCCHNEWYAVTDFGGRAGFLGVAYHA